MAVLGSFLAGLFKCPAPSPCDTATGAATSWMRRLVSWPFLARLCHCEGCPLVPPLQCFLGWRNLVPSGSWFDQALHATFFSSGVRKSLDGRHPQQVFFFNMIKFPKQFLLPATHVHTQNLLLGLDSHPVTSSWPLARKCLS